DFAGELCDGAVGLDWFSVGSQYGGDFGAVFEGEVDGGGFQQEVEGIGAQRFDEAIDGERECTRRAVEPALRGDVAFMVEIVRNAERCRVDGELVAQEALGDVFARAESDGERFAEDRPAVGVSGGVLYMELH